MIFINLRDLCEQEQVPAGSPLLQTCDGATPERESLVDRGHSFFLLGDPVVEVDVESRDIHVKVLVSLDRMVV